MRTSHTWCCEITFPEKDESGRVRELFWWARGIPGTMKKEGEYDSSEQHSRFRSDSPSNGLNLSSSPNSPAGRVGHRGCVDVLGHQYGERKSELREQPDEQREEEGEGGRERCHELHCGMCFGRREGLFERSGRNSR